MKIKTAEITGPALDWAVAVALGLIRPQSKNLPTMRAERGEDGLEYPSEYSPSTDWALSGPIIEREAISVFSIEDYEWAAAIGATQYQRDQMKGPTALIAALRCFVASKLGTEIDVHEELLA